MVDESEQQDLLRLESLRNEVEVILDSHYDDIKRIALDGPASFDDLMLLKMCAFFLSAYLATRRAVALTMEDDE